MEKTKQKKVMAIIMIVVLVALLIGSLIAYFVVDWMFIRDTKFNNQTNMAKGATYVVDGKESKSLNFYGKTKKEFEIKFAGSVEINTLALYEGTKAVTDFEIYNGQDLIYKQDEIGNLRYCALPDIKTDKLKIVVNSARKSFKITKLEAFKIDRSQNDFKVVSYIQSGDLISENPKLDALDAVTDAIIFDGGYFSEEGDMQFDAERMKECVSILKQANPNITVYLNFLLSSVNGNGRSSEELYSYVFSNYQDKLINNFVDIMNNSNADGLAFDYEYPYKQKSRMLYSDFLIELDKKLGDKKLTIAVAKWNMGYKKGVFDAVDMFQVMAYDEFDKDGYHSTFEESALKVMEAYHQLGIDKKKLTLGLPFYSRPTNRTPYWGEYSSVAEELGKYTNILDKEITFTDYDGIQHTFSRQYYNSVQMIRDKTAFAYDYGYAGVMIWHYNCDTNYDNPLSLFRAIQDIKDNK